VPRPIYAYRPRTLRTQTRSVHRVTRPVLSPVLKPRLVSTGVCTPLVRRVVSVSLTLEAGHSWRRADLTITAVELCTGVVLVSECALETSRCTRLYCMIQFLRPALCLCPCSSLCGPSGSFGPVSVFKWPALSGSFVTLGSTSGC
jgi:hypothetical protein